MAYKYGNRYQINLLPPSLEEYVDQDHPVRAYDAFVDTLDLKELGIGLNFHKVGNSEYHPLEMLKLLLFMYSYGIRSSRKIERECYQNLAVIWLVGGLRPDHKTIAEFRRNHKNALAKLLKQCAKICMKLDLIAGNVLFVDGSKIRANAGREQSHSKKYYQEKMAHLDEVINQLLEDCESADQLEDGLGSYVKMNKELAKTKTLKAKIKQALESSETSDRDTINQTDNDCSTMKSRQGSHACYNIQSVVDDKHGLIVHAEATNAATDINQLSKQVEKATEQLGQNCEVVCADAGYASTTDLEKIDKEIKVIVPSQRQALHEEEGEFSKSHFKYDAEKDCYVCPNGQIMKHQFTNKKTGKKEYQVSSGKICKSCEHYGKCTSSKKGRKIVRLPNEEAKEAFEAIYNEPSSREIYARRKCKVELPFGHIKRNLNAGAFLLRGKDGTQAETSILSTCFNMSRMMKIIGVSSLIVQLAELIS